MQKANQALDPFETSVVDLLKSSKVPLPAAEILAHLARQGIKASQPTLSRRLDHLVRTRHVRIVGAGRSTRYERDIFHDWFDVDPARRPKVPYDRGRLDRYVPNVTAWLTEDDKAALRAASPAPAPKMDASTYSRAIHQKLLVDMSFASSALEGNTYSYLDTKVLIEFGQAAAGKDADETTMILNHKAAISYLVDNIADIQITSNEIKTLHALLSRGLLDARASGAVRAIPVDIGGTAYVPVAMPQILEEDLARIAEKAGAIADPFEASLYLLASVAYLQAFQDVNKRTSRLACNIPLLKASLPPLSFMDVDGAQYTRGMIAFYELDRHDLLKDAFVDGYVRSARRYQAYFGQNRQSVEVELRFRQEIAKAVQDYAAAVIEKAGLIEIRTFIEDAFAGMTIEKDTREVLVDRTSAAIESLTQATAIAYGIPRVSATAFQKIRDEAGDETKPAGAGTTKFEM